MVACETPKELLEFLERGLRELFKADAVALHLVYGDHSRHLCFVDSKRSKTHETDNPHGFSGIVGNSIRSRAPTSWYSSHPDCKELWQAGVDLEAEHKDKACMLHTVPFFETPNMVSAVCQFTCYEQERRSFVDDGSFNQYNVSHFKLLNQFLGYIQAYLTRWYPMSERVRQMRHGWKSAHNRVKMSVVMKHMSDGASSIGTEPPTGAQQMPFISSSPSTAETGPPDSSATSPSRVATNKSTTASAAGAVSGSSEGVAATQQQHQHQHDESGPAVHEQLQHQHQQHLLSEGAAHLPKLQQRPPQHTHADGHGHGHGHGYGHAHQHGHHHHHHQHRHDHHHAEPSSAPSDPAAALSPADASGDVTTGLAPSLEGQHQETREEAVAANASASAPAATAAGAAGGAAAEPSPRTGLTGRSLQKGVSFYIQEADVVSGSSGTASVASVDSTG